MFFFLNRYEIFQNGLISNRFSGMTQNVDYSSLGSVAVVRHLIQREKNSDAMAEFNLRLDNILPISKRGALGDCFYSVHILYYVHPAPCSVNICMH